MAAGAARARPRPGALHAVRPEPPARAHRARLAARDGHAGQLARADADLQGEEAEPARRRQPRPADVPGPAGRRHRHLQGVARAGRQGPGRPPRAVARDRPGASTRRYGETFPEPQAVHTEAPIVLGTDGVRKMSKSVGNTIDIFARARRHPEAGHVDGHRHQAHPADRPGPAGGLQRLPAPPLLRRRLRGDLGRRADGPDRLRRHQELLADRIIAHYAAARERYARADGGPRPDRRILEEGAERLRPMAEATMAEVREKMGLR